MKRFRLLIVIAVVLALVIGACQALRGNDKKQTTASDPATGVRVTGSVEDGELKVSTYLGKPGFSTKGLLTPVGDPVKISTGGGTLRGQAVITFPYPSSYDGRMNELFVTRYNESVGQWIPQGIGQVDTKKRTISVITTTFSYWSLARFDEEESEKQLKYIVDRNFYDSTLFSGFSGLFSKPSPAPRGCTANLRYGNRTITADVSGLMRGLQGSVCVGRTPKGKYMISIGNTVGYPVLLSLPQAVKVRQVVPERDGIFGVFTERLRVKFGDNAVVLRGGQRVVLEIDPEKLHSNTAAISARMDLGHVFLDLSSALLQVLVPLAPDGKPMGSNQRIALSAKQIETFGKMLNCYTEAGQKAQEEFVEFGLKNRVLPLLKMHNAIIEGLSSCSSETLKFFVELLTDPTKWLGDQVGDLVIEQVKNRLKGLLKARLDQALSVWKNAGVFTQFFTSVFALIRDRGITTYQFSVTIHEGEERPSTCKDDPTHGGVLSPGRWFPRPCQTPVS